MLTVCWYCTYKLTMRHCVLPCKTASAVAPNTAHANRNATARSHRPTASPCSPLVGARCSARSPSFGLLQRPQERAAGLGVRVARRRRAIRRVTRVTGGVMVAPCILTCRRRCRRHGVVVAIVIVHVLCVVLYGARLLERLDEPARAASRREFVCGDLLPRRRRVDHRDHRHKRRLVREVVAVGRHLHAHCAYLDRAPGALEIERPREVPGDARPRRRVLERDVQELVPPRPASAIPIRFVEYGDAMGVMTRGVRVWMDGTHRARGSRGCSSSGSGKSSKKTQSNSPSAGSFSCHVPRTTSTLECMAANTSARSSTVSSHSMMA